MSPEGAVALVTGGASGLGRAIARALRDRSATVVVADLPDARERAESAGDVFVPADVRDADAVGAAVAAAAGLGPLRIVVNCAGIGPPSRVPRKGEAMALEAFTGGIVGMTLPIARDLAQSLIRRVTIAPGIFDTPLLGSLLQPARVSLGASVPHPARLGDPAEFGALVVAIVENEMLNGEVIRLDGALRIAPR